MLAIRKSIMGAAFIFLATLTFPSGCGVIKVNAQEVVPSRGVPVSVVSDEVLTEVRNILFPLDLLKERGVTSVLVLRFTPSFKADRQIAIVERKNGVEVVDLTSLDGNVYYKLNEILRRTSRENAAEMAKQIHIDKRVVTVSPTLIKNWQNSLSISLCATLSPSRTPGAKYVILDGTFYSFWYISNGVNISYHIYGSDIDDRSNPANPPLVQWMNDIRRAIFRGQPAL